ncbi:MAG: type III-B CRISPR-associated protein Cas10/Cmr2 [Ignisphaera sp.]|uniref:Type III-B CRISPR-associated protein Cas10/Cmr2 n=1 Tax=Ignisphaera aggregans TaxID=334771 RepID=A0A7J3MYU0_9CREN
MMDYGLLALLKIRVLLHDPLNKSFLLRTLGPEFSEKHRDVARNFLSIVLSGTSLARVGLGQKFEGVVDEADRIASAFDRWILKSTRWPSKTYVYYDHIHNVFSPRIHVELGDPPRDADVYEVARELSKILAVVGKFTSSIQERELLLYNTLFTLLEPIWYSKGLPPSLADTRTPTHTVFDHLYASVTMVNMLLNENLNVSGFYAMIDFPGIQKFVNAGRKVGDVWASSWLLSNLVWNIDEYFMNTYGYDVVVSPTPRLNPYALRTLLSRLLGLNDQEYELIVGLEEIIRNKDNELNNTIKNILEVYRKLYSLESVGGKGIQTLWLQPLIPATTVLLIPKIKIPRAESLETENGVAEKINGYFINAWKNIVDFVESKLISRNDVLHRTLGSVIESIRDILSTPPQGVNIAIVRIEDVYKAIKECITNKNRDICDELGLKNINLEALHHNSKIDLESLAKSLLWYILVTRSNILARIDRYGKLYNYMLRPFWTYSGGQLESVDSKLERFSVGWIPCSLCGQEPAYIVFRKDIKTPNQVTFKKDDIDEFLSIASIQNREDKDKILQSLQNLITYIFKPGEALGPYCLLKRALYISFRDNLEILSTDDVALSAVSVFLKKLGLPKILEEEKIRNIGLSKEDLEYLFTPSADVSKDVRKPFKDIYALANIYGMNYEDLNNKITKYLVNSCKESGIESKELLKNIAHVIGIPTNESSKQVVYSLLLDLTENNEIGIDSLCRFLGLRTQYAIVRGDADDIGKIMSGQRFGDIREYKEMIELIKRNSKAIGSEDIYRYLEQGYENAEEILKALGLYSLPLSPAIYQAISLSLMLTAISDYKIVRRPGEGTLIYSGGDDVTAFLPIETAIDTVTKLREEFYSSGFKKINNIPITSAIPTGRSFSIRIVNIMDVMSTEIFNAMKFLEERAKKAVWTIIVEGKPYEFSKDTLIITSSRSSEESLFPLKVSVVPIQNILNVVKETPLLLLTILSKNIPEDYRGLVGESETYMDFSSLYNFFKYVLERNVKPLKSMSSRKNVLLMLYKGLDNFKNLSLFIGNEKSTAIREYIKFLSIVRGII